MKRVNVDTESLAVKRFIRSLAGIAMDIGAALGFWNLYMTIKHGKLIPAPSQVPANYLPEPKWS